MERKGKEWNGFNPRSRMGSDPRDACGGWGYSNVSIRAPAWGATLTESDLPGHLVVSIRAPAWGATN